MLQQLNIQNYAIIDSIEIRFSDRLNIITGETGAGKSILMGALSLILGERADTTALLNREKKCIIEGQFLVNGSRAVLRFLEQQDLDPSEDILLVRREIGINGKSRAFINDSPVNLDQLRRLSNLLVDLHQQFDTLSLGDTDFQRAVLDALAGNGKLLEAYRQLYRNWETSRNTMRDLEEKKKEFAAQYDYNRFLFDELDEAGFRPNELEDLDAELKLLSNAEGIKAALESARNELSEGEQPLVQQLKRLLHQLQAFSSFHPQLPGLLERLQSTQLELSDVAADLERVEGQVQYDPVRIGQISDRIAIGYKLQKKHQVNNTAGLLAVQALLEEKLQAVLNIDDAIQARQKQTALLLEDVKKQADILYTRRLAEIEGLEKKVNALLRQVGMPNARLKVELVKQAGEGALHSDGIDKIEFLFDANKSNRFESIRKVASGGELSRLMLCIKSLVAESLDLPTLIFDEIDSGISGEAARQAGIIMKGLAGSRQLIAITHQPQIAGRADAHFFVYKEIQGDKVKTNIRLLSHDERITTIARMLSGEKPTAAALENAREMLMN